MSDNADVLYTDKDIVIVSQSEAEANVLVGIDTVTVIQSPQVGPQGPPGPQGEMGDGTDEGDFIRWDAVNHIWKVTPEPLDLTELKLSPKLKEDSSGGVGTLLYDSDDDHLWVNTT